MGQNTQQIVKRYSLAFKQQVVREYEAGASASALKRKYGMGCEKMAAEAKGEQLAYQLAALSV